jgi:hypothetical protein
LEGSAWMMDIGLLSLASTVLRTNALATIAAAAANDV